MKLPFPSVQNGVVGQLKNLLTARDFLHYIMTESVTGFATPTDTLLFLWVLTVLHLEMSATSRALKLFVKNYHLRILLVGDLVDGRAPKLFILTFPSIMLI